MHYGILVTKLSTGNFWYNFLFGLSIDQYLEKMTFVLHVNCSHRRQHIGGTGNFKEEISVWRTLRTWEAMKVFYRKVDVRKKAYRR